MHFVEKVLLVAVGLGLAVPVAAQSVIATDTIEYDNNLSTWVVGQVKRTTTNGIETSRTEFTAIGQPRATYSFGKLQQTLTYNADGTLATASDGRDGLGAETTITLSSWKRGVPQNIKYPATPESPSGATQSSEVNNDGTIAHVIDENGNKTCYTYDAMGQLTSITYPSESQAGVCDTTTWAPTALAFTNKDTPAEYGLPAGHWRHTVSTGNARKVLHFDAMWRPVVEEAYDDANASATRSLTVKRYDDDGHLAFQSYPLSTVGSYADATLSGVRTSYDALDRVAQVDQDSELGVLRTKNDYLTGFQTRVTNPRNIATTTGYMVYDQPSTEWPVAIVHPEGAYTDIGRDVFGEPTSLTRHNADNTQRVVRSYVYNTHHELCRVQEPETGISFMGYDAAGNLAWSAAGYVNTSVTGCADSSWVGARRVDRTYDARNRLTTLTFPDGRGNQSWSYTPDGLPSEVLTYNDPNVSNTYVANAYTYNHRRLLTGEGNQQVGLYAWGIGYGYNANGHLATLTQPGSEAISLAPNALGQPTQAVSPYADYAKGASYYPNGALKQFTYGNGIVHTLTRNARGLPQTSQDAYSAAAVLADTYDYDQNGNVLAITDGASGTNQRGNRTMAYDGLDRLAATVSPMYGASANNTVSYSYDVFDNLTHVVVPDRFDNLTQTVVPGRDHWYCYDPSWRLTNVKTSSCNGESVTGLGYDVQGNLSNKNGQEYNFDFGNRLRYLSGKESYTYDAFGRRVSSFSPWPAHVEIRSMYGQDGVLRYQQDFRKNKVFNYIYLAGSLVGVRETTMGMSDHAIKYQHTDALGTPVAVTGTSRNVIERSEYEPYGALLNRPIADGPGFTGHVMDAATGLTYMQQRYYDPTIGRFLSVDPVTANSGTGANFNRYWYANNNPYKFTDPDGRQAHGPNGTWNRPDNSAMVDAKAQAQSARLDALPVVGDARAISKAVDNPTLGNVVGAVVGLLGPVGDRVAPLARNLDSAADAAMNFFRGAKSGEVPSFVPRASDFKVDTSTGFVKDTHGVSVFDNPGSVSAKGFVPHQVDQASMPDSLRIIQRGSDPHHYEIVPKPGANMTPQQFINACSGIVCKN